MEFVFPEHSKRNQPCYLLNHKWILLGLPTSMTVRKCTCAVLSHFCSNKGEISSSEDREENGQNGEKCTGVSGFCWLISNGDLGVRL